MRVLLDTHAFLWFILNNSQLSVTAKTLIADPASLVYISPASYWELAIKVSLGKYTLSQPYQPFVESQIAANRFSILAIEPSHTAQLISMPHYHKDPFDRLIVAQALSEKIAVISGDKDLDPYGIVRMW